MDIPEFPLNLLPKPVIVTTTDEDRAKLASNSTGMAIALGGMQVYGGTVPPAVIARRRAKNKRARAARRVARRAAA